MLKKKNLTNVFGNKKSQKLTHKDLQHEGGGGGDEKVFASQQCA